MRRGFCESFFLVEGERTEPKIYRKWVEYSFPKLTFVNQIQSVTNDCYCIFAGGGYPKIFTDEPSPLEICLRDIKDHGGIDHFFICLDSEEDNYQTRFKEVETELETIKKIGIYPSFQTRIHIIVQHCCIETWFLGHSKMLRKNPQSQKLSEFKKFYNVSINDPELMDYPKGYLTKASFHLDYLKEMLREKNPNLTYTKKYPGSTTEKFYLEALRQRCEKTGHLPSLKRLFDIWDVIKRA
jgi:hypothetical protein